jgi:Dolichyl-phosphate-mannose-protein mannosyltransferase
MVLRTDTSSTPGSAGAPKPDFPGVRLFSRDGLFCATLLGLCILATWPVAEIGINDDWSYILTTRTFAQTHHFVYNGWATAILGWQVIWGALFARIFGPSFTSIRLSAVPIALATALLYHVILRRFGLNRAHAIFGTLTLTLCPLFLALADTFMSDVPGLFSLLLCLYLCQLAIAAREDSRATMWLVLAGLTNVLSGTVRQISWLGVLVMVPSCAWLLRRRRYVIPATVITWLIGVASIKFFIDWFLRQPYSVPETFPSHGTGRDIAEHLAVHGAGGVMTTLLFLLPVLTLGLSAFSSIPRRIMVRMGVVMVALLAVLAVLHHWGIAHVLESPWLGNTFSNYGLLRDGMFRSDRKIPEAGVKLLFFTLVITTLASIEVFNVYRHRSTDDREPMQQAVSWRKMIALLVPLLASYCMLLLPRAALSATFDRYLLVIMAAVIVFPVAWHQEHISGRIPAFSIGALAVIAILAVADMHDLFSMSRAEVRLSEEMQNAGIPRTEIEGGFAYDFETQVYATGYINDPHIINPPGAYHPVPPAPVFRRGANLCGGLTIQRYLPSLHVRYAMSAGANPCFAPANLPPQSYTTWLQPGTHQVFAAVPLPPEP